MTATRRSRIGRAWLGTLLALAFIAALYLSTLAVNHSEAEDSTWYAHAITRGSLAYQFHPNHLLYNFVNRSFYRIWQAAGYGDTAELPAKVLNVAAALLTLALLARLARRAGSPAWLQVATVLATAASFGFWWYSVEIETYVLPLVFVFLALRQLLDIRQDFAPPARHALLGVFAASAILLHQQHLMLGLVILAGYLLILREARRRIALRAFIGRVALFGAVSVALIASAYLVVMIGALGRATPAAMIDWLRSAGNVAGYGYGLSLGALKSVVGLGRAFVGGHYLFAFPAAQALARRIVPNYDLREEVFLVQDFAPTGSVALAVLTLLLLALAGVLIVWLILGRRAAPAVDDGPLSERRALLRLLGVYIALYGLFNALFLPESVEVWVAVAPAIMLAFAALLAPHARSRSAQGLVAAAIALLLVVNLFGSVLPQLRPERDYWRQFNAYLIANAEPRDLIVMDSGYISGGYVTFYSGAVVFDATVGGASVGQIFDRVMAQGSAGRVLFAETASAPVDGTARAFYHAQRAQLELIHADQWQNVYLYQPASR